MDLQFPNPISPVKVAPKGNVDSWVDGIVNGAFWESSWIPLFREIMAWLQNSISLAKFFSPCFSGKPAAVGDLFRGCS